MITVVPVRRTAPTAGNKPLRMAQNLAYSSGLLVNSMGRVVSRLAIDAFIASTCFASASGSAERVSTSKAAASSGRSLMKSGMPGFSSTERNPARSISSTADTGVFLRIATASQVVRTVLKKIKAEALFGCSSTVR